MVLTVFVRYLKSRQGEKHSWMLDPRSPNGHQYVAEIIFWVLSPIHTLCNTEQYPVFELNRTVRYIREWICVKSVQKQYQSLGLRKNHLTKNHGSTIAINAIENLTCKGNLRYGETNGDWSEWFIFYMINKCIHKAHTMWYK